MREQAAALIDIGLLRFGPLEWCHILRRCVAHAVDGHDIRISVRHDARHDHDHQDNRDQYDDTAHRERVLHQLAHTVLKKGSGFAHHVLLLFFFICRFFKFR